MADSPSVKITDNSADKKYFVITPQLVWAHSRDPYDYTLWNTVKMIAGDDGECYLHTADLAALSMMSVGKVSDCRQYLLDAGLLEGEIRQDPGYPQPVWHLKVPDLWQENIAWRTKTGDDLASRIELKKTQRALLKTKREAEKVSPDEISKKVSPDETGPSPDETLVSPDEIKENQRKKNQKEEPIHAADAAPASAPVPAADSSKTAKKEPTGKNAIKQQLAEAFSEMTAIPLPPLDTQRQGKEAGVKWFKPLLAIAAACDGDPRRAREVIQAAIEQMDADSLTIAAPQSIEKVAVGIAARCKREQGEKEKRTASIQEAAARAEAAFEAHEAEVAALDPALKIALDTWSAACEFLQGSLPRASYAQYIAPLEVLRPNGTFRLRAPTPEVHDWLENRLRPTIERALDSARGRKVVVEFVGPEGSR